MVAIGTTVLLASAGIATAQLGGPRGQKGHCFGGRFHNVNYDMSHEKDEKTGYPVDFTVNIRPDRDSDHLCPSENGAGERDGVCVGVNTKDCQQAKKALKIDDYLSCDNCFIGFSTDIVYDLEVKRLKPQKVLVGLHNMHLRGAMEFLAHQSASKTVAKGSWPIIGEDKNYNIFFMLADILPININFKVPTELTYEVDLKEEVDLRFGVDLDWDLGNHDIEWDAGKGFSAPHTSPSVHWTPVLEATGKVEADIPIGLNTKIEVEFEKVLEFDIEFKPSLPLHAEMDFDSSDKSGDKICLSSGVDFEIDGEADLRFEFFGKKEELAHFGPWTFYTHHWPKVFDKCWPLAGDSEDEEADEDIEDDTTVPPTVEPETTVPPVPPATTVAPDPSLTLKQCRACFTMCAPCQACAEGATQVPFYGSCDKCWQCWNFNKDKAHDEKHMDKDCDVMHHDHDWDDHTVRCLTDSPKSSKVTQDCRPCWATFPDGPLADMMEDMMGDMMIV